MTTTLYLLDDQNCFAGEQALQDPYGPLPKCVMQPPPTLEGDEVAHWYGAGWEVLQAHPAVALAAQATHNAIVAATAQRLTDFAATRGYSSLDAISKYKDITDAEIASLPTADQPMVTKFRAECRYLALVTAQTWAVLYRGLAEVQAGTRPMPSGYDEIKDELPALVWPV